MTVMEQAKILGQALALDPAVIRLNHAKEAYENDRSLRGAMQEYNALRAGMGEEFKKDEGEQDRTHNKKEARVIFQLLSRAALSDAVSDR